MASTAFCSGDSSAFTSRARGAAGVVAAYGRTRRAPGRPRVPRRAGPPVGLERTADATLAEHTQLATLKPCAGLFRASDL